MNKVYKLFFSKRGQQIWLGLLLILPIILWILPGDFFDGEGLSMCPSRLFFGIECFGCGITRSVMHMHHLQFGDAVFYNTLGLIVYPALIIVWIIWVRAAAKRLHYLPLKEK